MTDTKGCKVLKDSIKVGLDSTGFARLGPDTLKCNGLTVILSPLSGDQPGNVYQWSTGATAPFISVAQPGSYSLVVRNTQTGCVGRSSIRVGDRPSPNFSFTQQASLCEGDLGKVQLSASGAPGLRYLWLTRNDTTKTIVVDRAGNYTVQVTDPQGCTAAGYHVCSICANRV
ncbi:hypothetical protein [Spirosoma telluris]|uniref:hypothetical protein n=1 Tax=Spirosoma telluris TaxID=2183553 RepID=UPI002FC2A6A9